MRNDLFLKQMGSKIKAARIANKFTLKKLSEATGIHLTSLWFIENGRHNVHVLTLKAIADVFKIDLKDIIG
ncbi:MAG: helix-turn-helix domain-containing protein [Flavisolibacter sp.]